MLKNVFKIYNVSSLSHCYVYFHPASLHYIYCIIYIYFKLPYILAQPYCSFHPTFSPLVLFSVLAYYDVGTKTCFKIQAFMRRVLRSPNLVECKGKLLLVAALKVILENFGSLVSMN